MSNIGSKPITIPLGYKISIRKLLKFNQIIFNNKKFTKYINVPSHFSFSILNHQLFIHTSKKDSFLGTLNRKIQQIFKGTFKKQLTVVGVGYKLDIQDNKVITNIGYSHPLEYPIPNNIKMSVIRQNIIEGESDSLEDLMQFLSTIWLVKPADKDKYKGKGYKFL